MVRSEDDREQAIKTHGRKVLVQRIMIVLAVIWGMLLTAFVVWSLIIAHQERKILVDCTTPGGECYQRSQERTGEVVQQLFVQGITREELTREIVRASAFCADKPGVQTLSQLEKCVEGEIE